MSVSNILVVAVDGLRASSLGAFGNTTFATPAFDRFAAESLLLDWCYAPTAGLDGIYRALWQGPNAGTGAENSLPRLFATRGYDTALITDDATIASLPGAADFRERVEVGRGAELRADDVSETAMAQLFEAACDVIENRDTGFASGPRLVWVHSQGMYGPWDAPLDLQRQMLDEGDPPLVESVTPPDFVIGESDDPDAAFRYGCAYAAQTLVLDQCWEGLLEVVSQVVDPTNWLVMLLGVRGFPLGEHRRVGGIDSRLYSEQLHVPWLIRFPDGHGRLRRSGELASHVDVLPTLLDSVGQTSDPLLLALDGKTVVRQSNAARAESRDALVATSNGSRAIRTESWCLRQELRTAELAATPDRPSLQSELFVRPDDRWEANDVAKLCPEVVEELTSVLDGVQKRSALGKPQPRIMLFEESHRPDA